jgi:hypothetical protein
VLQGHLELITDWRYEQVQYETVQLMKVGHLVNERVNVM